MTGSTEDGYYFCHICNHSRLSEEVIMSGSGDFRCIVCDHEGFVEKISTPVEDDRSTTFRSFQQTGGSDGFPMVSETSYESYPETTYTTFGGMPINSIIQRIFNGAMSPMRPMGTMETATGVRFHTSDAQTMAFQQGRVFDPFSENAQLLLQTFLQNPLDTQAMNQFIYYVMDNDPNRQGSPPTAKSIVESLEVDILDEEQAKKLETCAICTEDFSAGDRIHWLAKNSKECEHAFHVDCIVPWLKQHNTCPVCRYELPTDDEDYNRQRQEMRSRLVEEVQRHVDASPLAARDRQQPEARATRQVYTTRRVSGGNGPFIQSSYCHMQ
ncbi:hypothetical protein BgAZ_501740 [Babesia gibsoni]|uniref:RING-type E3 ubiquitin transferase n=1 Tax=Babesia gibsoni TaxID=33632 RepID=A0AAD8PD60_BABGI|nr:hypothetical protein BgAZ_501740 [Babesia gibsoni]